MKNERQLYGWQKRQVIMMLIIEALIIIAGLLCTASVPVGMVHYWLYKTKLDVLYLCGWWCVLGWFVTLAVGLLFVDLVKKYWNFKLHKIRRSTKRFRREIRLYQEGINEEDIF